MEVKILHVQKKKKDEYLEYKKCSVGVVVTSVELSWDFCSTTH